MKTILGIDIGYGSVKCVLGSSDGDIKKLFKFTSIIAATSPNAYIKDTRIFAYKGKHYYVGNDALQMPSDAVIDITEYKNLEYFAPLFLHATIKQIGIVPDIIVCGLSKAQLHNSGYFKEALQKFTVDDQEYTFDNVWILPQGAGSKLAIDKYGDNFPRQQTEFQGLTNYIGVDIGFNTLDIFLVTNGKTSPNLFEGIECEGVMKIAQCIQKNIQDRYSKQVSLHEAKEILDNGFFKLRGEKLDLSELIKSTKKEYLSNMLKLVDERFKGSLDKSDFVFLTGGGSAFFKIFDTTQDRFIRAPQSNYEYYNSIGFYLFGAQQAQKLQKQ